MKNVFLSVMVVTTLLAAGLGGTFAHFSDTEESKDNWIQTGSLDLKISDVQGIEYDDLPYGSGVPALIFATDLEPKISKDFTWNVHNAGQPEGDPCYLYMHVKEPICEDIPPHKDGILCPGGKMQPEPEIVAEHGGWVDQVWVPGVGCCFGSDCELADHIDLTVWIDYDEDGDFEDDEIVYDGKLAGIVCTNWALGRLDKCQTKLMHAVVRLQNIDEDDLIAAGIIPDGPAGGDGGYFDGTDPDVQKKCWDKWPTNALMKDKITFSILFSLVDGPTPP